MKALWLLIPMMYSCTPTEPGPVQEYKNQYYENTTFCVIMFPDRKHIAPAATCAAGSQRVAVGSMVTATKGDCEPAFMSLNGFKQIWGCEP